MRWMIVFALLAGCTTVVVSDERREEFCNAWFTGECPSRMEDYPHDFQGCRDYFDGCQLDVVEAIEACFEDAGDDCDARNACADDMREEC